MPHPSLDPRQDGRSPGKGESDESHFRFIRLIGWRLAPEYALDIVFDTARDLMSEINGKFLNRITGAKMHYPGRKMAMLS